MHKSYGRGVRKGTGMPGKPIVSRSMQYAKFREELREGKLVVVVTQPTAEITIDNSPVTFDQKKLAEAAAKGTQPKYEVIMAGPDGTQKAIRRSGRREAEAEIKQSKGKLASGWKMFLRWFTGSKTVVKEIENKEQ
jgi:hypothetical protein